MERKILFGDHLRESLLVSFPLFGVAQNHITRIPSVFERGRLVRDIGFGVGALGGRALSLLTSTCLPAPSYQCWAMPLKVPQPG